MKYLGVNLTKERQNLQGELDKMLLKISEETEANGKTSHVNRLEDNIVKMSILPQLISVSVTSLLKSEWRLLQK